MSYLNEKKIKWDNKKCAQIKPERNKQKINRTSRKQQSINRLEVNV